MLVSGLWDKNFYVKLTKFHMVPLLDEDLEAVNTAERYGFGVLLDELPYRLFNPKWSAIGIYV